MLRVIGLKPEKTYGKLETGVFNPDFHHELAGGSFKLNDEPFKKNQGSRTTQIARAGSISPEGSTDGSVDLQRVGHYFYGALDQYKFHEYANDYEKFEDLPDSFHAHEFWGGEEQFLHSFTGWVTFDLFMKKIRGLLVNSFKLEVSDEEMSQSADWVYQTEKKLDLDQTEYEKLIPCGAIPIMNYDVYVKLGDAVNGGEDPHSFTSLSFELGNNINTDNLHALGSRFPKRQGSAQEREISLELVGNLTREDIKLINGAEYGNEDAIEPSNCELYKTAVQFIVRTCNKPNEQLIVTLPSCTVNVEYEMSESDEIETTFTLTSLGNNKIDMLNGTKKMTDIHCVLVNEIPEISCAPSSRDEREMTNETITFKDSTDTLEGVNVRLIGLTDSLEIEKPTAMDGTFTCSLKKGHKYKLYASKKGYESHERKFEYPADFVNEIILDKQSHFDLIYNVTDSKYNEPVESCLTIVRDIDSDIEVFNGNTDCRGLVSIPRLDSQKTHKIEITKDGYTSYTEQFKPTEDKIIPISLDYDVMEFNVKTGNPSFQSEFWSGVKVSFYEGTPDMPDQETDLVETVTSIASKPISTLGNGGRITNSDLESVLSNEKHYFMVGENSFFKKDASNYKQALVAGDQEYSPSWISFKIKGKILTSDYTLLDHTCVMRHDEVPFNDIPLTIDEDEYTFTLDSAKTGGKRYIAVLDENKKVIAKSDVQDCLDAETVYEFTITRV